MGEIFDALVKALQKDSTIERMMTFTNEGREVWFSNKNDYNNDNKRRNETMDDKTKANLKRLKDTKESLINKKYELEIKWEAMPSSSHSVRNHLLQDIDSEIAYIDSAIDATIDNILKMTDLKKNDDDAEVNSFLSEIGIEITKPGLHLHIISSKDLDGFEQVIQDLKKSKIWKNGNCKMVIFDSLPEESFTTISDIAESNGFINYNSMDCKVQKEIQNSATSEGMATCEGMLETIHDSSIEDLKEIINTLGNFYGNLINGITDDNKSSDKKTLSKKQIKKIVDKKLREERLWLIARTNEMVRRTSEQLNQRVSKHRSDIMAINKEIIDNHINEYHHKDCSGDCSGDCECCEIGDSSCCCGDKD